MNEEIRKEVERIKREWDGLEELNKRTSRAFDSLINTAKDLQNSINDAITVEQAVDRIRLELQKDKEPGSYFHTWQCNIAMCFFDEIRHKYAFDTGSIDPILNHNLHMYSNNAAARFLEILCLQNNNNIGLRRQSELQQSQPIAPKSQAD